MTTAGDGRDAELLDVLLHDAPVGVAVFDRDLVLRRCNATWAEFVERHGTVRAAEVVPGRTIFDYFPGSEPEILPAAAPVLEGKTRSYQAVPHARHDGTTSYWDLLFVPLRRDGEVVGVVDVALDVTERQRAEHELRRSERRFQSIMLNSSDVTIVVDPTGELRYAGPSVLRLIGVSSEEALGRDVMTPVHRDDVAVMREMLGRAVATPGESGPFRCRLRHVNGSWRTFEALAVNLLDDPDVEGIVLNFRDVTERAEAEAELRCRDAILEAVRFAAHRFLESPASWRDSIDVVLGILGTATDVSRVYIFENFPGADGSRRASQSYEWVATGITAQIDNPALQNIGYPDVGFGDVSRALGEGEVVAGPVAEMGGMARAVLQAQDILSIAMVPIFVGGRWWGFIGFDECLRERRWSAAEIDALRAAASTLSAAIHRQRAEDQLREQQKLLETRINALSTIAASLTVNQAPSDTFDVIAESVVAATPALACSAHTLDPESGQPRTLAGVGLPPGSEDPAEGTAQGWREDPGSGTVVTVPLESQGCRLGSVNAYYPRGVSPSPDDIAFLRAVADQGAVAVENARLLAEAQSKAGLEERQRLARELHDSVSQALYGIALGARTARSLAEHSPDKLAEPLDYVLSLADAGMTEMRSLIFALRPESLATEGLVAALQKQVAVLRARHRLVVRSGLGAEPRLPLAVKETLYRIGQEALHNTVKHAHAGQVEIRLDVADGFALLEVGDDGVGFDPAAAQPGHLGLQSMRERAATHRGNVEIQSRAGAGTTVRVRLPVPG